MAPKRPTRKTQAFPDTSEGNVEQTEAERLSFLHLPRPFKNPRYTRPQSKKLRSTKQILAAERERERLRRETGTANKEAPTYITIEAAPSLLPQKRYCDITGLEAPYTDPQSKLRYHNKAVYEFIKSLPPGTSHECLAIRGQHSVIR
ncbi:hypothetical protein DACRYDRAFT_24543 [Dacryopinax primogenitus]|uniref:Vps72/YL1 C-terminal domain-containing protein n=1 Tax=Dacryopinax primogenitus (strain DJM 731) TaxID=1858805 RepID=M5FY89_DACPD|nr:uncharacterized protein DACRYDRAFT_24543 [Dacryopinax primogenitus]EJT98521.1 hypothetical protein DACRYDRAFT_24543 [Dacryopinax primogenitus]